MLVKIFTSFLLLPSLSLEGRRQNSIDSHLTSLEQPRSEERGASRVQNNFVVLHQKDSRPGSATSSYLDNTASIFSSSSPSKHHRPKSQSSESSNNLINHFNRENRNNNDQRRRESRNNNNSKRNCTLDVREDETFLWRIDTQPPSYFFGTIHVPYTRVWDAVSDNAKKAFKDSDQVYFELDLTNPYTIASLTSCQLLPRGLNLSQVLPPGLYSRLRSHLGWVRQEIGAWITEDQAGRGLYADYLYNAITGNWERKRPVWAMLMVNGLTASDIASRGFPVLDLYLAQLAEEQQKKIGAVERVEEQCLPLNGLTYGQVIFALNQTLQQHEDIRRGVVKPSYTTDDLISNYQCGNLNSVVFNQDTAQVSLLSARKELSMAEQRLAEEIDSYFKDHLIYKRNRRMGGRVIELLLNNPGSSFFFAFGAGHFVGEHTIIDVVRRAGFTVEPVKAGDDLDNWVSSHVNKNEIRKKPKSTGTVKGTFDDLSDDEKTKAFLQLLEYKLRLEAEQKEDEEEVAEDTDRFHELWQRLPSHKVQPDSETEEEKTVRESIQVWYGINDGARRCGSLVLTLIVIARFLL